MRRETGLATNSEEGRQEYSNSRQESLERIMDDMAAAAVANELADGESDPDVKEILKSQDPSSSTDDAVLAYKFQLSEGYRVC